MPSRVPVILPMVVLFALGAGGLGGAAEAQDPAGETAYPSAIHERVDVSLVLIEAVVVDKAGRHMHGLSKEDFTLQEAGHDVEIVTFDEVDLPRGNEPTPSPTLVESVTPPSSDPAPTAGATETAGTGGLSPDELTRRLEDRKRRIVILFDSYYNASPLHLVQARRAAKKFLRERMRPADLAAVYEMSPFLRSITSFSNDIGYLEDSLDDVRWYDGQSLSDQISDATVYGSYHGSREQISNRILSNAAFGATQAAAERMQFFQGVEALGTVLAEIPGRKLILMFSGGFPIILSRDDMATGGFNAQFRRMIKQLERSRTTVYSMNIGEDPAQVDASARSSYRDTLDFLGFGQDFVSRMGRGGMGGDTAMAYNQMMAVIAGESGGRFFPGRNYDRALRAVDDDTHHFYLLGYRPPSLDLKRDRYRTIDIEVRGKGLRAVARQGRFVLDEPDVRPRPTQRVTLPEPAAPEPVVEYELSCTPVFFPADADSTLVSLMLRLDGPVSPVRDREGAFVIDLSTQVVVLAGEEEVERRSRSFRSNLKSEAEAALRRGLRLTEAVELARGSYRLEVDVRLNGLGIEAGCARALDVPGIEAAGLALAGLSMLPDEQAPPVVADYFAAGVTDESAESRPTDPFRLVNDWRVDARSSESIPSSRPLTVFFRVHGPTLDPATGLPAGLSLDYVLAPTAGGEEILPPMQVAYFKPARVPDAFDVMVGLDLSSVTPGPYRLRVDAHDAGQDRRVRLESPVRVTAESNILDQSK